MKVAAVVPVPSTHDRARACIRGTPLFLWAANNVHRVLPKQDIYIESDQEAVLTEAKAAGFQPLKRPASMTASTADSLLWEAQNIAYDILIHHLPTTPFLKETTIRQALQAIENGKQSAFGVRKEPGHLWTDTGPTYDLRNPSHSLTPPVFTREGMGFYVTKQTALAKDRARISPPFAMIDLDQYEAISINNQHDLTFARTVANGLPGDSEYVAGISTLKRECIKFLVMDMDGVMTDGRLYFSNQGFETLAFHVRDGSAMRKAIKSGIRVAILSATEQKDLLAKRADYLGVTTYMGGCLDKAKQLAAWCEEFNISAEHTAYIGDDLADLGPLQMVGHSACPADADDQIKRIVRYVLPREGGRGCVGDFIHTYILDEG